MSVILYSKRYQCDVCLKQAETDDADQQHAYLDEPVPEGWTSLRAATMRLDMKDFYGGSLSHLCDECSALPVGQLIDRMKERLQQTWAAQKIAAQ